MKQYKDEQVKVSLESGGNLGTVLWLTDNEEESTIAKHSGSDRTTFSSEDTVINLTDNELRAIVTFARELGIQPFDLTEDKE